MKYIRDTVHGYIAISDIEEKIINLPEVLRLHWILQNSTLFQTYPSNRESRFAHSLGAMHIAGRMYKSLVRNSQKEYIKKLHEKIMEILRGNGEKIFLEDPYEYLVSDYRASHGIKDFYSSFGWSMRDDERRLTNRENLDGTYYSTLNNIIFQAVRLAALVHDVGHLPYSHVMEHALKDILTQDENKDIGNKKLHLDGMYRDIIGRDNDDADIHEKIGIILIEIITKTQDFKLEGLHRNFFQACWKIAIAILSVDQLHHFLSDEFEESYRQADRFFDRYGGKEGLEVLYPLGQIISSQVDCDRMDYLQRDPKNSGNYELSSFDMERILNSMMLVHPTETKVKNVMVIGFGRQSLSAVTDLIRARASQIRWNVKHHNVVRTDMALVRIIPLLYRIWNSKKKDVECERITSKLKKYHFHWLWDWGNLINRYRYITDAWLDTMLLAILHDLVSVPRSSLYDIEKECLLYLKVFYERKVNLLRPVWKRLDRFYDFSNSFFDYFCGLELTEIEGMGDEKVLGLLKTAKAKEKDLLNAKVKLKKIENTDKRGGLAQETTNKRLADAKKEVEKMTKAQLSEIEKVYFTNRVIEDWIKLPPPRTPEKESLDRHYKRKEKSDYSVLSELERYYNSKKVGKKIILAFRSFNPYKEIPIVLKYSTDDDDKDVIIKYLDKLDSNIYYLNEISERDIKLYAYEVMPLDSAEDKTQEWSRDDINELGVKLAEKIVNDLHFTSIKTEGIFNSSVE